MKSRIFYGWWIVAATFLAVFAMGGVSFYASPLFYAPLQAEFGWSRTLIAITFTAYMIFGALISPFIGSQIDRYGVKRIMIIGAIVCGLGFVWLSFMNSLVEFYIAYCIVGAGVRAFGIMPATKIVSNWFIKKRGTALGIATVSFGLGGFVLSPIIGGYVIPTFGWRAAYLTLAFVALVLVIPASALILKTKPSDIGLFPDGVKSADQVYKPAFGDELTGAFTLKSAVATSAFWLITISFMISNFSHMGLMQHQVVYLTNIGYPIAIASTALGNVGLFSAISKFVMGWLCDKIPAKFVATICFFFKTIAILLMIIVTPTTPTYMFWIYAFSMGNGVGGWTTSLPILLSGNFGLKYYGAILGMFTLVSGSLAAFGPQVASIVFDTTESYASIFWTFFALSALSVPLMLMMRRPKNKQPATT